MTLPTGPTRSLKKPVAAYDNEGKFVQSFESMTAANRFCGIQNGVHRGISHPFYRSGGYYWRAYEGEPLMQIELVKNPKRIERDIAKSEIASKITEKKKKKANASLIIEMDQNGVETGVTYRNASHAAEVLDVTRQMISLHLTKPKKNLSVAGRKLKRTA